MAGLAKNVNSHHINWEKRHWQKNNILRKLRDHHGLIIPMNLFDHRDLHHDLLPPPKPTPPQAEDLLYILGPYDSQSERTDYLDIAIKHMTTINPAYAAHLLLQRGYVLLHPMTLIEREMVEMEREGGEAA